MVHSSVPPLVVTLSGAKGLLRAKETAEILRFAQNNRIACHIALSNSGFSQYGQRTPRTPDTPALSLPASGGRVEGISETDLLSAVEAEFAREDIFPPTEVVEDWLKLLDYDPENVVKVSPIRPRESHLTHPSSVI